MTNFLNKSDSSLEFLVKASIAAPLTILLVPTSFIIFLLSFIYLQCIYQLARCFGNSELCEPLTMGSAAIALLCSPYKGRPKLVILPMLVVEGVPDIQKIKKTTMDRWFKKIDESGNLFYPELLWTLGYFMGYPYWKRISGLTADIALEKYVKEHRRMGGWDYKSLLDFTKQFGSKPFKEGEPLWEFAILEDYHVQSGSKEPLFAVVGRLHHSLTDGVGGMSLVRHLGMAASENVKFSIPRGYYLQKYLKPLYRGVYDTLTYAMNNVVFTQENSVWPENRSNPANVNTPQLSAASSLSLGSRCATLTAVRKLAKAWDVSCTAVILTGILRSLKTALYEEKGILPSYVVLSIPLPSPEHSGKLRNSAFLITTLLPLYVEDPAVHAAEVDKEYQTVKISSLPHVRIFIGKFCSLIPRWIWENWMRDARNKSEAVILSTTVGPKGSSDLCGYKVKEIGYLLPVGDGASKFPFFQMLSMADKLYLSLTADKELIEDDAMARRIVIGFHEEIASFAAS